MSSLDGIILNRILAELQKQTALLEQVARQTAICTGRPGGPMGEIVHFSYCPKHG